MADEEHHIDFLETQLDLVSRLGLETLRAAAAGVKVSNLIEETLIFRSQ